MKNETSYRVTLAVVLCIGLAVLTWYHKELAAIEIGCWSIIFVAGVVRLVSNLANSAIRIAVGIAMLAAGAVLHWTSSAHPSIMGTVLYVLLFITVGALLFLRRSVSSNQGTHN
jgi:hypothetical protein